MVTFTRDPARLQPAGAGDVAPASLPPVVAAAATVSPQAATAVGQQRDAAAAVLVDLFRYLEAHAPSHPALAPAIPLLGSAVAEWRAGTSPDVFAGARSVYEAVQAVRRSIPSLPDP